MRKFFRFKKNKNFKKKEKKILMNFSEFNILFSFWNK